MDTPQSSSLNVKQQPRLQDGIPSLQLLALPNLLSVQLPRICAMLLPIEVWEGVIDQASDDTKSLRHLSLTCIEFLPRARYHLFAVIVIRTEEQWMMSPDFIDAHRWLPSLVRKVTISFPNHSFDQKGDLEVRFKRCDHFFGAVPVHLLTRFPNLRMWSFESFGIIQVGLSFHRSALRCYQIYSSRIHHLELFQIWFDRMSDFTRLVSAFMNIHTITCSNIQLYHAAREENNSSRNTLQSRSLSALQVSIWRVAHLCD